MGGLRRTRQTPYPGQSSPAILAASHPKALPAYSRISESWCRAASRRADDRLAADVSPVHQHAVNTGCAYSGCTYGRSSYHCCSSHRSPCRSACNAGTADRRERATDPGLRATCGQ